eukprot:28294_1
MVTQLTMKCTLFTLLFALHVSNGQWKTCEDVFDTPLTDEICREAEPESGECCELFNGEACIATPCNDTAVVNITAIILSCPDEYESVISGSDFPLFSVFVPDPTDVLIISVCDESSTEFNSTLTLFDDTMEQIAQDYDGCNDDIGRSRIRLDGIASGEYFVLLSSPWGVLEEHEFKINVECNSFPDSTTSEPCEDCPYNVTVTAIANISIEECPEETPSPTVWSQSHGHGGGHGGGHHSKPKPPKHGGRKLSSVGDGRRRRLGRGYEPPKPWDREKTPSPTPWMADRICVDRDERVCAPGRRRLWGYRPQEDDGSGGDKARHTPSPTQSGFTQWYKDKCGIKDSHEGWGHGYSTSTYGHTKDKHAHGQRYTHWSKRHDHDDEFLTEVCITYTISGYVDDDDECGEVESVFLGICENNNTDFNSSTLDVDDLTDLIVSINNNTDEDIQSASGAETEDTLGILVVFEEGHSVTEFELCLGNVTVDTEFNEDRENIDLGDGLIGLNGAYECEADGLPCLNFFFDIPCPPETTEEVKCECIGGMTSLTLLYDPSNGLNATIIGYYNAKESAAVMCEFENVAPETEIECASDSYYKFSKSTYFVVHYIEDTTTRRRMGGGGRRGGGRDSKDFEIDIGDCSGKFETSCREHIIGTTSNGCDDLEAIAFVALNGTTCDYLNADAITADNALISGFDDVLHASPLAVLEELDPYVRYSLIGLLFMFAVLTIIACCVCVTSKDRNEKSAKDNASTTVKPKSVEDSNDVPTSTTGKPSPFEVYL